MSDQQKPKRIVDHLPLKKYNPYCHIQGGLPYPDMAENEKGMYIKLNDIEALLLNLGKPENLNKIIKAVMFGSMDKLNLDELLK